MLEKYQRRSRVAAVAMKCSFFAVLLTLSASTWVWVQEGREPSVTIWILRLLPVAMFVHGVYREQRRPLAWMCFVLLMYFTSAVTQAMSSRGLWINYVEVGCISALFVTTVMFIHWAVKAEIASREQG
ncbi:MAG: DUF2069 domain-containing protein [Spongiibacteraceae bacterium]